MHTELEQLQAVFEGGRGRPGAKRRNRISSLIALHLDFVVKPNSGAEWTNELAEAIAKARLDEEGLKVSLILVSDREARLVTLLTFWERSRFLAAREYCIAWMQKLLAPFADGPIRAHSSVPQFLNEERSVRATVRVQEADGRQFREIAVD